MPGYSRHSINIYWMNEWLLKIYPTGATEEGKNGQIIIILNYRSKHFN